MEKDVAAVEETLLALAAQACPDQAIQASRLDAARYLISYALSGAQEEVSRLSNSDKQPTSDACPAEVLQSCSALQPLLGQTGIWNAIKVLSTLRGRMQHLNSPVSPTPEPRALSYPASPSGPQHSMSALKPSAASASAAEAHAPEAAAESAESRAASSAASPLGSPDGSHVSCSARELAQASRDGAHVAGGSRDQTVHCSAHTQTLRSVKCEQQGQLPHCADLSLQRAAKVNAF